MMKKLAVNLLAIAVLAAAPTAWAAPVSYEFSGVAASSARTGSTYSGVFTFDDALLIGFGDENLLIDAFSMTWTDSSTFTEIYGLADVGLSATFFDGIFLGLSGGSVTAPVFDFEFIAGFLSLSEAFFAYESNGTGNLSYVPANTVAAPATAPLLLLGGLAVLRRRRERARSG